MTKQKAVWLMGIRGDTAPAPLVAAKAIRHALAVIDGTQIRDTALSTAHYLYKDFLKSGVPQHLGLTSTERAVAAGGILLDVNLLVEYDPTEAQITAASATLGSQTHPEVPEPSLDEPEDRILSIEAAKTALVLMAMSGGATNALTAAKVLSGATGDPELYDEVCDLLRDTFPQPSPADYGL